jgi:hypothetical protein
MQLLYCANGVVVGIHDDSQSVSASAYPAGTRIIPYGDPLDTLTRVGTLPPPPPPDSPLPPPPDMRLYGQPTETVAILLAYAAQVRYNNSILPVSFTTAASTVISVNAERIDSGLLNNLATHAQSLAPTDPLNFTQDNVTYAITAQDAIGMFNAVLAHVQACRNIETDCITDLNSASPTIATYDDVDAKFAGV